VHGKIENGITRPVVMAVTVIGKGIFLYLFPFCIEEGK
jgi:hypothetical protein